MRTQLSPSWSDGLDADDFMAWSETHLVISPLKLLDMGEIDNEDESGSDHGLKLKIGAYLVPSKPFSPQRYPEVVKKLS